VAGFLLNTSPEKRKFPPGGGGTQKNSNTSKERAVGSQEKGKTKNVWGTMQELKESKDGRDFHLHDRGKEEKKE